MMVESEDPEEVKEQIANLTFDDKRIFMEYLIKEKAIQFWKFKPMDIWFDFKLREEARQFANSDLNKRV